MSNLSCPKTSRGRWLVSARRIAQSTPVVALSLLLLIGENANGDTLLDEKFETDPILFFQGNGVFPLSAPGPEQWASGQLDSTLYGDIDGETAADIEDGLAYSDERHRSFLYFFDLGDGQAVYSAGDNFTASVNVGANPLAEFPNMTVNIGVFTTNTLALGVDTVHPSTTPVTMDALFTNEENQDASDYEFYEVGVTTLAALGVTVSGIALPGGEGQPIGNEANKVKTDSVLTLNGTFTEAHRYIGLVFFSNVGTNSDNTRWIAFDNAKLEIGAGSPPSQFEIVANGSDLVFTWDSRAGKVYDLLSSTDPEADGDPSSWPVVPGQEGIAAEPDTNTLIISRPVDEARFYAIREENAPPPPPAFFDDFESDQGWGTGFGASHNSETSTTEWERGSPSNVGPLTGANGSANCFGTDLSANYTLDTEIWLRSPAINLPQGLTGAALSFLQHRDTDLDNDIDDDYGTIRVLRASDLQQIGADLVTDVEGFDFDGDNIPIWVEVLPIPLPAEAIGEEIVLEFRFKTDNLGETFAGWYVDDVTVAVE